jgi:hypothetical protein
MLAEEYSNINSTPFLSNQEGKTVKFIFECLRKSCAPFKKASRQPNLKLPLNENKYTQIFVEQIEVFVKSHPNIGVKNQYSDTFYGTKGIPDFYFHKIEEGVHNEPLMVWEAKILSTCLGLKREKEYVIGHKFNGGIERFKIGIHGRGQNKCGLLGFVENNDFDHWNTTINKWIYDLTKTTSDWKKDEVLSEIESNTDYCVLKSIAHRKEDDIYLTHLWIKIN